MSEKKGTNAEIMNGLFEKYSLNKKDHIFTHAHYTIITRAGIDMIQAQEGITIDYEVLDDYCSPDHTTFLIKATGTLGDVTVTTFGEVTPKNNHNSYPVAMAEKRAMSRIVLKLAGLYALNVFGEDEADDFKATVKKGRQAQALTPEVK